MKADRTLHVSVKTVREEFLLTKTSPRQQQHNMEYQTVIIVAQTILASIVVTAGIMYCFFQEAEKEKKD